jgi:hypothetical protein
VSSKKRNRQDKKKRAVTTKPRVAKPKARLRASFDVLAAVTRAADKTMKGLSMDATPPNRVQAGAFVRGINALKSVHALAEQSQWEFAAAAVRQLFELLINMEELLRQDDVQDAAMRYVRFGLMQKVRGRYENLVYARDTGRSYDAELLGGLEELLETMFAEFRTVTKKGKVVYAMSWCGKTARQLADASAARIRPHQYTQLFSAWSEQAHGSPSTMLDDFLGTKASDLEGLLQADEPRTAEVIAMAITLFVELWQLLPAIPNPEDGVVKDWTGALIEEAVRWRSDGVPDPPVWQS